ncbi:hypothetical protein [Massilia aerilata]|uniref:Uncharacterized protein n=1 Tax=Massilia aerilata TaxID=453817 RepID=A0ABW0S710_9BURK
MTTRHMAIAMALGDHLKALAIAGGRVDMNRVRSLSSNKDSAVVVRLARAASQEASMLGGRTSWSTLIDIECYGRDGANDVPGAVADLVLEQVFDALAAGPDLGYGVMDIEPLAGDTLAWDFDQLDNSVACVTARFVVKHQTNGRTLKL